MIGAFGRTSVVAISIHANVSSSIFTLFRKPSLGIPTQTVARFSEVGSVECKPLFCFYISSLFACLM